ncbi:MAG: cell division protein ZapA [Prolixibacteraceae bacterium]|jgi:cell division protein ZapA|nr:cell division protein ZapA [Prolixibacteraceae bacterium]
MDDKLAINIMIAERRYPMTIDRGDEEKIRKAAKILNERVLQYRKAYTGKDNHDFLAMTALQFVIKMLELSENQDVDPFIRQIEQINSEVEKYLGNI